MATQYTRTYIYKRENDAYRTVPLTIPWSSFRINSGDTAHTVKKLVSATVELSLYVGTAESAVKVGWTGTFSSTSGGDVSVTVRSDTATKPGKWGRVSVSLPSTFNAAAFNSLTQIVSDANYGNTHFAKSSGYLYFTIVFEDEEFIPKIESYIGNRYNGTAVDDLGQQFQYTFTLSRVKTTTEATVEYPSYINFSIGDTVIKTLMDTRTGSTMAQVNALIGSQQSGVISNYTFSIGAGYDVQLNFCYHGELVTDNEFIGKSFVNLHLSGATDANGNEIGGVAIGQYSSVTRQEGQPKFECDYPAYFSNGVFDETGHEIGGAQMTGGTITKSTGYGSGAVSTKTFSFGKTFATAPIVMCEFARLSTNSDGSGTSSSLGSVALSVSAVTTTQFTVTVWNNSGRRFYGDLVWLAIETSASTTEWA